MIKESDNNPSCSSSNPTSTFPDKQTHAYRWGECHSDYKYNTTQIKTLKFLSLKIRSGNFSLWILCIEHTIIRWFKWLKWISSVPNSKFIKVITKFFATHTMRWPKICLELIKNNVITIKSQGECIWDWKVQEHYQDEACQ